MRVKEIAERINAHLERLEKDPIVNAKEAAHYGKKFYNAGAWASGRYVRVIYVSYHGSDALSREQAERYLARLDAGHTGPHWAEFTG